MKKLDVKQCVHYNRVCDCGKKDCLFPVKSQTVGRGVPTKFEETQNDYNGYERGQNENR